jgi:integrase
MIRFPSYLQRNSSGIFYFRIAVPDALKSRLKLREFKRSLRTHFKHEATFRAQPLALTIRHVFAGLAEAAMGMTYLEARALLQRHLDERVAAMDRILEQRGPLPPLRRSTMEKVMRVTRKAADEGRANYFGRKTAKTVLERAGIAMDPASEAFKWFSMEATKVTATRMEVFQGKNAAFEAQYGRYAPQETTKAAPSTIEESARRFASNPQGEREAGPEANGRPLPAPNHTVASQAPQPSQAVTSAGPALRQVLQVYMAEKLREGSWTPKTADTAKGKLDLLVRSIGDIPVRLIGAEQARDFKQVLQRLPANINTKPLYRSKTIQQILAMDPEAGMSVLTVNGYLTWSSTFFDWAERNGYVDRNPFKKLFLRNRKRARDARAAYTPEDLQRIFSTPQYRNHNFKHAHYYWLPLLGLFSGARINELCQLDLKDIRHEDDVLVLDINESGPEKRVKTRAARRLVPVHPKLVQIGFLQYVETLRNKGETKLFPELKPMRDGAGQAASKWFARYRRPLGLYKRTPKKDFHSFRTTFINLLKQKGHAEGVVAAIVGHAQEGLTFGTYGKAYSPLILARVIADVSFETELLNVSGWSPSTH